VSGPITRSRSRANSSFGESVDHTSAGMTEHTELMGKLSELLNAIEKSTRTNQQSQEQFAESTEKGIRSQTDFLTFQEQHQTQLATLLKQNSLQVGPALQPTPFFGKPTEDLAAFLSHFERYSNFCGWDSKQCLRALPLYLQGNAGSWYASLNTSFDSYDDLTKALKEQFSNPASIWLLRQQLSARKQNETESLANYAAEIRRLCKRLSLNDSEGMHYFIQGLHPDLKSHVILGQPKTLAEAENLAQLKEAVSLSTPKLAQYKLESQLQSVITSLEALASNTQQNQPLNMAAYNSYSKPGMSSYKVPNSYHEHHHRNHPSPSGPRNDSNSIAKLVREEVRRQTQYLTQANRPSNSGVPSTRNRRTTDGLPICNKCDKVGHIARNCRGGRMQQFEQAPQYNSHTRPSMQRQHQFSPQYNSYIRPGMQQQFTQRPQYNSNIYPDAPTFNPQQRQPANNPFNPESGN